MQKIAKKNESYKRQQGKKRQARTVSLQMHHYLYSRFALPAVQSRGYRSDLYDLVRFAPFYYKITNNILPASLFEILAFAEYLYHKKLFNAELMGYQQALIHKQLPKIYQKYFDLFFISALSPFFSMLVQNYTFLSVNNSLANYPKNITNIREHTNYQKAYSELFTTAVMPGVRIYYADRIGKSDVSINQHSKMNHKTPAAQSSIIFARLAAHTESQYSNYLFNAPKLRRTVDNDFQAQSKDISQTIFMFARNEKASLLGKLTDAVLSKQFKNAFKSPHIGSNHWPDTLQRMEQWVGQNVNSHEVSAQPFHNVTRSMINGTSAQKAMPSVIFEFEAGKGDQSILADQGLNRGFGPALATLNQDNIVNNLTFLRPQEFLPSPTQDFIYAQSPRSTTVQEHASKSMETGKVVEIVNHQVESIISSRFTIDHLSRVDYARITDHVYSSLTRRLLMEKERLGLGH